MLSWSGRKFLNPHKDIQIALKESTFQQKVELYLWGLIYSYEYTNCNLSLLSVSSSLDVHRYLNKNAKSEIV